MKSTEGRMGRVFVLRLDDGDVVPTCIEDFAARKGISVGYVSLVGGIGGGEIVVGPKDSSSAQPTPVHKNINEAHEVCASGVIAPDQNGNPVLHIHGSLGRGEDTTTGCLRPGVKTWMTGEVILHEILDADALRVKDETSGFDLLQVGQTLPRVPEPEPIIMPEPMPEAASVAASDTRSRFLYLLEAEVF